MKERKPEDWEKEWIRTAYEKLIANNPTKAVIAQFRLEYADLLKLSERQVRSITAWKREGDGLVLRPQEFDVNTISTSKESDTVLLENLSIDLNTAEMALGDAGSNPETSSIPNDQCTHDLNSNLHIEASNSTYLNNDTTQEGINGLQYKNERKEKWFREWLKFITQNTSPEWRLDAKVITLAGPLCLRLKDYTDCGFSPENIIAVEGGSSADKETFMKNLPPGFQKRLERLEKFIGTETIKFDVVDYDFLGAVNDTYIDILAQTPIADRAFVLVNVMGRRESAHSQEILKDIYEDFYNQKNLSETQKEIAILKKAGKKDTPEEFAIVKRWIDFASSDDLDDVELSEARMNVIGTLFTRKIGSARAIEKPQGLCYQDFKKHLRLEEDIDESRLDSNMFRMLLAVIDSLKHQFAYHGVDIKEPTDLLGLVGLTFRSLRHTPLVKDIKKVHYKSEKSGTPYFSVFAEIENANQIMKNCPITAEFIKKILLSVLKISLLRMKCNDVPPLLTVHTELNAFTLGLRDLRGKRCQIKRGDTMHVCSDGISAGKINVGVFLDELNSYNRDINGRWHLSFPEDQTAVPWEKVN